MQGRIIFSHDQALAYAVFYCCSLKPVPFNLMLWPTLSTTSAARRGCFQLCGPTD